MKTGFILIDFYVIFPIQSSIRKTIFHYNFPVYRIKSQIHCASYSQKNFTIFYLVTLNEVPLNSKINDNFRHSHSNFLYHSNMILLFLFDNYLVSIMTFVTMIPSNQKTIYYPFVVLIILHLCLISG